METAPRQSDATSDSKWARLLSVEQGADMRKKSLQTSVFYGLCFFGRMEGAGYEISTGASGKKSISSQPEEMMTMTAANAPPHWSVCRNSHTRIPLESCRNFFSQLAQHPDVSFALNAESTERFAPQTGRVRFLAQRVSPLGKYDIFVVEIDLRNTIDFTLLTLLQNFTQKPDCYSYLQLIHKRIAQTVGCSRTDCDESESAS